VTPTLEEPLSQSQKKSGAGNISDLKARLGLKKGGPAAQKGAGPASGGIVAPPGVAGKSSIAVPVPPGARAPQPKLPDASEDPFAAMNAMAAMQRAVAAPEIVIVNDGKPVENVGNQSPLVRFGIPGGIAVVMLLAGWLFGQMSANSNLNEEAFTDAATVGQDMKRLRQESLQHIQDGLWKSQEKSGEGKPFPVNDEELTQTLANKKVWPVLDPEIFTKKYYVLDKDLVTSIVGFYSDIITIRELVEAHVKATENDSKALKESKTRIAAAKPDESVNRYLDFYRYGVILSVPTKAEAEQGKAFGARLVEIGPPVCQDGKLSNDGKCPDAPRGFGVREQNSSSPGWAPVEIAFGGGDGVPGSKLLPLLPNEIFESLYKGTEPSVAEAAYMRRVNQLNELVKNAIETGSALEKQLSALQQ
jgi:hypothetical protein